MRSFILILLGSVSVAAIPMPQLHAALVNSLSGNFRPVWPPDQLITEDDAGDMLNDDSADEKAGIEKRFAAQAQISNSANIPPTQTPTSWIPSGTASYIAATTSSTTAVAEKTETPNSRHAISRVPLAIQQIPTDGYSNNTSANSNTTHGSIIDHTAPPPAPRKSLIPHWSDRKSSIAATTVFSVVTAAAFTFIIVVFIRRLRGSWKRHKRTREEDEKQTQQAMTDVRVPSSDDYLASDAAMYEEKEERVWWLFNNRSRSPEQQNSPGDGTKPQMSSTTNLSVAFGWKNQDPGSHNSPSAQGNTSSVDLATLDRQCDLHLSTSHRRGSLDRNPVVVPSPVTLITSWAARESSAADEKVTQDTPQTQAISRPQRTHVVDGKGSLGTASTKSAGSNRLGLLPSIQRTDSPFLKFSEG